MQVVTLNDPASVPDMACGGCAKKVKSLARAIVALKFTSFGVETHRLQGDIITSGLTRKRQPGSRYTGLPSSMSLTHAVVSILSPSVTSCTLTNFPRSSFLMMRSFKTAVVPLGKR